MADRAEDWLALQLAQSSSPFRDFQRPDAPFEAPQPDPDEVYTTRDINRIADRKPHPVQKAFKWLASWLPEPQRAGDQIFGEGETKSVAKAIPRAAINMAWSDIPRALLHSGEEYAGAVGAATQGKHAGGGFAGTGVTPLGLLAPPQGMAAFIPGMSRRIMRGETDPISTYDKVRAKIAEWQDRDGVAAIAKSPNPYRNFTSMSLARNNIEPAGAPSFTSLDRMLQTGRGPGNVANEMGRPSDRFRVIKAESGERAAPFVVGEGLKPQKKGSDSHLGFGPSLGAHTEIRTNFPEADFWITRRGSADKLGSVSDTFNPESFGVRNRNHQIDPTYLRYALEHVHNQGWYKGRGHGTTNLQNIRLEDVRSIPIEASPFRLFSESGEGKMGTLAEQGPIRAYHASTKDGGFDKFRRRQNDIGVHFGTKEQANDRLNFLTTRRYPGAPSMDGAHILPVDLHIRRPLRLDDVGWWSADNVGFALERHPAFGKEAVQDILRRLPRTGRFGDRNPRSELVALRDLMHRKGYDGIVYRNTGEVAGSDVFRAARDVAWEKVKEAQARGELPPNGFREQDMRHPAYEAYKRAEEADSKFREANGADSYIATKKGTVRSALTGEVLFSRAGDSRLAGVVEQAGRRAEPLPLTAAVADWIEAATGKKPVVEPAHGAWATDYVKIPDRPPGYPYTQIRVPSDGHAGKPRSGTIDTAASGHGKHAGNDLNRYNAAGEPFSKPENLIEALKWATSSSPEGNWLVSPGKEPRWARYAKDEAPQSRPESPFDHPRLSSTVGELWARGDGRFQAMLAAMKLDPDKAAAVQKTLEKLQGISDSGIARVLEAQHGLAPAKTIEALGKAGSSPRRWFSRDPDAPMIRGLDGVAQSFAAAPPRHRPTRHHWTDPANRAKLRDVIAEGHTTPGPAWRRLQEKYPELAEVTSYNGVKMTMHHHRADLGLSFSGSAQPLRGPKSATATAARSPEFAQKFWSAWDRHAGHGGKVAEELGISRPTVSLYKRTVPRPSPQSAEAAAAEAARLEAGGAGGWPLRRAERERQSQAERTKAELERRGGKPFWDEHGKAAALEADLKAVQEMVRRMQQGGGGGK